MLWLIAGALAGTATLIGKIAYDRHTENQANSVAQTSTRTDDDASSDDQASSEVSAEDTSSDLTRANEGDITEVDFLLPIPMPLDDPSAGTESVDPIDPILLPYDDTDDDENDGIESVDTIDPILLPGDEFSDGTETVTMAPVNTDDWI